MSINGFDQGYGCQPSDRASGRFSGSASGVLGSAADRKGQFGRTIYINGLKRTFDVIVVLLAMPFVLPIILLFALAVMLDGSSPFFAQERVGRGGKVFRMWKLRSMIPNAQKALEAHLALNPAARREWDEYQKLSTDPRITPVGLFIRKTSIDELPQLFNVLFGDMSLVGPRPIMVEQIDIYPGSAYYTLRPGVTGFWQVSKRNESTFADRAVFDAHYAQTQSFLVDLGVLFRTVSVVLKASGR
jgi:lipopolysaccharide/colanic/teichoic acid biosynthesis glycosyltransferase